MKTVVSFAMLASCVAFLLVLLRPDSRLSLSRIPATWRPKLKLALGTTAIISALVFLVSVSAGEEPYPELDGHPNLAPLAYSFTKDYVEGQLVVPVGATFPAFEEGNWCAYVGDGLYHVTSYVDANNGSGVKKRSAYRANVDTTHVLPKILTFEWINN